MGHNYEYVMLYPEQIKKEKKYQREIDENRIKKILKNWNDDLVNPPKVSLRESGIYYVFDGQHTLIAWKRKYGNTPILCKVFRGLTEKEEMELFVQQTGESKPVGKADKLRAKFKFGEEKVVDMVNSAAIAGCVIDFDASPSNAKNRVNAVVTAYAVYEQIGRDLFINTLDILRRSFLGEQQAFCDGFIKGMGYLFKHHSEKINVKKMVDALSNQPVQYYRQAANSLIGSVPVRYAKAFADQYNKKKKAENRIDIKENNPT